MHEGHSPQDIINSISALIKSDHPPFFSNKFIILQFKRKLFFLFVQLHVREFPRERSTVQKLFVVCIYASELMFMCCIRMTSNHYDNRNLSGFYTLLEDEMFGKGKTNASPAHKLSNTATIIRRYGTIWDNFDTHKVRMYLYEPIEINSSSRNLVEISSIIRAELHRLDSFSAPTLQHNFAEDSGAVKDRMTVWESDSLFSIKNEICCNKLIKLEHFASNSLTKFDFHVRIN